jgi:hypothetical protein
LISEWVLLHRVRPSQSSPGIDIRNVVFGLAAAEQERFSKPELLLDGFLDAYGLVAAVRQGTKFLILGPKGSGKSAIASRIELLAHQKGDAFVTTVLLGTFPYDAFSGVLPGTEAREVKYTNNWELILLVTLLESFSRDPASASVGEPKLGEMMDLLKALGLTPARSLTDVVKRTGSREFKVGLPGVFHLKFGTEVERANPDIKLLYRTIQQVAYSTRSPHSHIVFVDGLDDILTRRGKQYEALAALVLAAERINRTVNRDAGIAKIVVLCRTDLFDKLPDPNKNKIRQDNSVTLDWYQNTRDLMATNLVNLADLRASMSLGSRISVFEQLLPPKVFDQPTVKVLFENTRHTPRDLIQLLNRIRSLSTTPVASESTVKAAIRKYSEEYLLPEMRDELCGLVALEDVDRSFRLLGAMGRRMFYYDEVVIEAKADARFEGVDLRNTLDQLFACGAVGNFRAAERSEDFRFSFKFRNPYAEFNPNDGIVIHRGISPALNVS